MHSHCSQLFPNPSHPQISPSALYYQTHSVYVPQSLLGKTFFTVIYRQTYIPVYINFYIFLIIQSKIINSKNGDEVIDKNYSNSFDHLEHRDSFLPVSLDICNIAGHILGPYTDRSEFSRSKQILLFNLKSDISIPHSSQSTFTKQQ